MVILFFFFFIITVRASISLWYYEEGTVNLFTRVCLFLAEFLNRTHVGIGHVLLADGGVKLFLHRKQTPGVLYITTDLE